MNGGARELHRSFVGRRLSVLKKVCCGVSVWNKIPAISHIQPLYA